MQSDVVTARDDFVLDAVATPVGDTVTIGVITLDGAKHELTVGSNAEGTSRWVQAAGNPQIFSISSWAGDWTVAEVSKFQKKKDGDKDKDEAGGEGEPPDMPGMPGMAPYTPPPVERPQIPRFVDDPLRSFVPGAWGKWSGQ